MTDYKILVRCQPDDGGYVTVAVSEIKDAASAEDAIARFASGHLTLMTDDERAAVRLAGELYTYIERSEPFTSLHAAHLADELGKHVAEHVIGHGPTREADLSELQAALVDVKLVAAKLSDSQAAGDRRRALYQYKLTAAVHVIQHAVMAQAAARAYPGEFRLLGEVISPGQEKD